MSDEEKQEIIDRLLQDHEVRSRVVESAVDRLDAGIESLRKTVYHARPSVQLTPDIRAGEVLQRRLVELGVK